MEVFEVDEQVKEPFLRLPGQYSNIILTPPRATDASAIVGILNDPSVYPTLEGPPYPYEHRFALDWLEKAEAVTDQAWKNIQSKTDTAFGASPVRIIRQINEDGTQTFLGDCGIDRWGYPDIECAEEQERLTMENLARPVGDRGIVWSIGDYLASSHHGQGIMTAVVECLMERWAVPHMNVHKVRVTVHEGNEGSIRVFAKNGFVVERLLPGYRKRAESKGGGSVGLQILAWDLSR